MRIEYSRSQQSHLDTHAGMVQWYIISIYPLLVDCFFDCSFPSPSICSLQRAKHGDECLDDAVLGRDRRQVKEALLDLRAVLAAADIGICQLREPWVGEGRKRTG